MTVSGRLVTATVLILGLVSLGLLLAFLVATWGYYSLSFVDRPFDPRHEALRPSGSFGLVFGLAGTLLMILNLTYLARKKLVSWAWLGSLGSWMKFHVLTGLLGPGLILFHAAWSPHSALGGLSLAAMSIVVITGLVGRFIYAHVPRSVEGHELELHTVRKRLESYRQRLQELGARLEALTVTPQETLEERKGILVALLGMVRGNRESARRYGEFRRELLARGRSRPEASEILPLARMFFREEQWLARYHDLRGLMSSWRFFHRWLAITLFLVVSFHIGVAVAFGNLWILRGAP